MNHRVWAALVCLFVGTFILFQGATPMPEDLIHWGMIVFGVALVVSYVVILGGKFETRLKKSNTTALTPVLLAVGVAVTYQSIWRAGLINQLSLAIPGVVLILASSITLRRKLKAES